MSRLEIKALFLHRQILKLSIVRAKSVLLSIEGETQVSGEHSRRSYLAINWTDCLHISALLAHLDKTNIYG